MSAGSGGAVPVGAGGRSDRWQQRPPVGSRRLRTCTLAICTRAWSCWRWAALRVPRMLSATSAALAAHSQGYGSSLAASRGYLAAGGGGAQVSPYPPLTITHAAVPVAQRLVGWSATMQVPYPQLHTGRRGQARIAGRHWH
jgi:hypothetical protein